MAKRRKLPNGFGSIEYVPRTASGKKRINPYRARLPASKDRKDIGFYRTYNLAFEALKNYKEPVKTDTFAELYMRFRETKKYKNYTKSTQNRYDFAFGRLKKFHDREIHTILFSEMQEIIDNMEEEGYTYQKDGQTIHEYYTKDSLNRVKFCLNQVFKIAIKDNIIRSNPVPELEIGGIKKKRKKEIFTSKEIKRLFDSIPYNPDARHILCLIFTGMRPGEYITLNQKNINLEENTITDFGIKTEAGKNRIMFIHPKIQNIVKELYYESNTGFILEYKQNPIPYDKVFYDNIYYPALEKADIKKKIPYSCRYTFATILYYSDVDMKVIQKLMGHENIEITEEFYIQDKENMAEYIFQEFQKIQS